MRGPVSAIFPLEAIPGTIVLSDDWYELFSEIFQSLWIDISGTEMFDVFGGDPLTLSESPGVDYIPGSFSGTITCPDDEDIFTSDTDNLWGSPGSPTALSVSDLVDQDYNRTLVKYDDSSPYHIRAIAILADGVVLSDAQKDWLSRNMALWVFFWGTWNDDGAIKENRTF